MISALFLAAEGLAQLGCGIGAGIATIGAGLGIQHDSDLCFR